MASCMVIIGIIEANSVMQTPPVSDGGMLLTFRPTVLRFKHGHLCAASTTLKRRNARSARRKRARQTSKSSSLTVPISPLLTTSAAMKIVNKCSIPRGPSCPGLRRRRPGAITDASRAHSGECDEAAVGNQPASIGNGTDVAVRRSCHYISVRHKQRRKRSPSIILNIRSSSLSTTYKQYVLSAHRTSSSSTIYSKFFILTDLPLTCCSMGNTVSRPMLLVFKHLYW
ncbi:hypothetical protein GGR57DRAFT_410508 [Xylariaceae sp. FL1272]|nr:hypothetical protein GGR57DRAFT_410508 [Xylariaceae sp. FL1272]